MEMEREMEMIEAKSASRENWSCKRCLTPEYESPHFYAGPDLCEACYCNDNEELYKDLEKQGHTCMRKLIFVCYPKVQWCGETRCMDTMATLGTLGSVANDTFLIRDAKTTNTILLTRMTSKNWFEIDDIQRFATFKEAAKGYVCRRCSATTSTENPVYTHHSYGLCFCARCVDTLKATMPNEVCQLEE